jgi:hypothetical protein
MVNKKADEARAMNRRLQAAYRKRHGEDLRKARRVASALMALRSHEGFDGTKQWRMNAIMEKLEDFLTRDEMKQFIATANLTRRERKAWEVKTWERVNAVGTAIGEAHRKAVSR